MVSKPFYFMKEVGDGKYDAIANHI